MSTELECIGCREIKSFENEEKYPVCVDCKAWEKERLEKFNNFENGDACSVCGYVGPAIDNHHVDGRKVSDITVKVCANCHREIHAGIKTVKGVK